MYNNSCAARAVVHSIYQRRGGRFLLGAFVVTGLIGTSARAAVTAIGDVLPKDNIATEAIEGLPATGNSYNPNVDPDQQDRWEDNYVVPGYESINAGIVVGQKLPQGGRLDIDSNSILRFQTLVIGDQGVVGGVTRKGTGNVLITGIEAMYSNIPTFADALPPELPPDFAVVADDKRAEDIGFDMYVGRYGSGKIEIRGGGRAEIQDAVIVGDQLGSSGEIIVDGFASLLVSGGFDSGGGPTDIDPHQMIVGRRGFGRMIIRAGGTVVSEVPPSTDTTTATVGAVIGSDRFDQDAPELGGSGDVYVNGADSKWVIGGSLQIGGFHDAIEGMVQDIDGNNVEYISEAGEGRLYVQDGAIVQIRAAIDAADDDDLLLAIGRFGRLILSGGLVEIGSGLPDGGREDNIQVLNDGVIEGSGRINTGVFINRYVGEVRVGPGESLIINATSEFTNAAQDSPPLVNFGVMDVLGSSEVFAEIEFERAPDAPTDPIQPFVNDRVPRPVGAPPADFYGGLISAQHSRMTFRSGLSNIGMVSFTAGENYVKGNVLNTFDPDFPADPGILFFRGPNTKVVFENDLNCGVGVCDVGAGVTIDVLARHSFITAGDLRVNVNPTNPTHITSAGDVGIGGKLTVSLTGFSPGSLAVGDSFEIISFSGMLGGVDLTDPLHPLIDLNAPPLFTNIATPSLVGLGLPAGSVLRPVFTSSSVLLTIRSLAGFVGPDFDGDGIVDFDDLAIWKANKGITMGATVLEGDANGDGAVNGTDYLIWFSQFGMPPMPGAGGGGSVPEPTGLVMLSMAGMLAMAFGRRRA